MCSLLLCVSYIYSIITCSLLLCVKAGRSCSSCLPSRLGSCPNTHHLLSRLSVSAPTSPSLSSTTLPTTAISSPSNSLLAPDTYHSDCTLSIPDLPPFEPLDDPSFTWGSFDGESCVLSINECYSTAVQWKTNLFIFPSGNMGEAFIQELSRLFRTYGSSSALESVAALLMPMLPSTASF